MQSKELTISSSRLDDCRCGSMGVCSGAIKIAIIAGIVMLIYFASMYMGMLPGTTLEDQDIFALRISFHGVDINFYLIFQLIFFFIIGLLFPDCWLVVFTIAAIFDVLNNVAEMFLMGKIHNRNIVARWYGKLGYEIFFQLLGYALGVLCVRLSRRRIVIPGFNDCL
jgi:hypothetical protein